MTDSEARYGLPAHRYLELIRIDGNLMADTAASLTLEVNVPTCPGWTVRDAVLHTAVVYLHKISCTRFGVSPDPWPPDSWPSEDAEADPVGFLRRCLGELLTELESRDPASPSATWWPPDQTVGFWCRRMALETAVHRVDVESAASAISAVDPDLALDGVDELIEMMLGGDWSDVEEDEWAGVDPEAGAGRALDLVSGQRRWRVTPYADRIDYAGVYGEPVSGSPPEATISGEASDLFLWMWGRLPDSVLRVEGDAGLVQAVRDRLALATQ